MSADTVRAGETMKHLLMVTFSWPPRTGTGTWRPLKFAKYLPRFGWSPTVLTATGWGAARRRYLPPESPGGCPTIGVAPWGDEMLARGLGKLCWPVLAAAGIPRQRFVEAVAWRTRKWLNYPTPGSDFNRWVLPLAVEAARLARTGRFQAVYVTSPPDSMALVAGIVSRLTLLPLVLDFRDPWSENFEAFYTGPLKWLSRTLERLCIRCAAKVLVVTPRQRADLACLFPAFADKIVCVQNGFDPDDIPPPSVYQRGERFVVVLMGASYDPCAEVFEAIRMNSVADPEFGRRFLFFWMGAHERARAVARELSVEGNVELLPVQPHDAALDRAARADALWLEGPMKAGSHYVARGKTYEYIALGRPILGTGPRDVSLREIAERAGRARLIESRKPEDIARLLLDAFHDWQAGRLEGGTDAAYVSQFRRDVLTGRLADVLNEVT